MDPNTKFLIFEAIGKIRGELELLFRSGKPLGMRQKLLIFTWLIDIVKACGGID